MPEADSTPGTVGPWRIERELGRGGMAVVFEASDAPGRRAALKWLDRATPRRRLRFTEEARFLERMDHPNIARLLDHGEEDGRPWLAVELVRGTDARLAAEKLRQRPPAEREARVRGVARDLCAALAHVHAQGVVHRDVKPANVLLADDGRAVLIDFGVAFAPDEEPSDAGIVGTAAWGAPEQLAGDPVDARADQYGLGGTLYLLLTGRRPFPETDAAALVLAHLERPVRPPSQLDPTIPPDLDALVMRLLAKRPAHRFRDMTEVAAAIGVPAAGNLPLAGRQPQIDAVAQAVDRVADGRSVRLVLAGVRGSGRHWMRALALDAASRRGVRCGTGDATDIVSAPRLDVVLADTDAPSRPPSGGQDEPEQVTVHLAPLGLADIRRSLYALMPGATDLAQLAERMHRESGGNAGLFLACVAASQAAPGASSPVDVQPWLADLDVEERFAAQALAALPRAVTAEVVEDVAQVPVDDALRALARAGVAHELDGRWRLFAEAFRAPLLDEAPDRAALEARARRHVPVEDERPDPVLVEVARLRAQGRAREAVAPLQAALAEPVDPQVRAARLLALGTLSWSTGDPVRARSACAEAARDLPRADMRSRALVGAGAAALQLGDVPGARDHLEAALVEAQIAGDIGREVIALVNLAEARMLGGALADGLRAATRAHALAAALRDRAVECLALRHLGQVLLELGRTTEAAAHLADAAALARAADLPEWRAAAWALRARANLDAAASDADAARVAASAALDRLRPLMTGADVLALDPDGILPRARGTWLRAAARLRDTSLVARARAASTPGLQDPRIPVRLEVRLAWSDAAATLGDTHQAVAHADDARELAQSHALVLHVWLAERAAARARRQPLPVPGPLALGLDAATADALGDRR
jgi:tetratricopeptide (TPR) repeat protein